MQIKIEESNDFFTAILNTNKFLITPLISIGLFVIALFAKHLEVAYIGFTAL